MNPIRDLASRVRRLAGARRPRLSVAAYCHAFDVSPEIRADGGEPEEG